MTDWARISSSIRMDIVEMSYRAQTAHLASALSCVDIMTVLYESILNLNSSNIDDPERDRFILSKGHAASCLYALLCYKGIITREELLGYGSKGSLLEEHPSPKQTGVEAATGSLGHGLPIANGIALASRINKIPFEVFVLMSDGECNEGTVWEAAMFAAQHNLKNVTAIIDFNKWQATGRSRDVLALDPLPLKWRSFGWDTIEVDGHDHEEIYSAIAEKSNRPRMLIAHTVKGKGVSFMEDDNNWHYRSPTKDEVSLAREELKTI